ncbi:hypothetical protein [Mariniflexile sp.]|uniref:hypothetical protein n=1 Tax=Mariniflexile sp. TaxID=1979402 RepID=UPI004047A6C9
MKKTAMITVNANYNLKELPQSLYVNGTVLTYRPDDIISIKEAVIQGLNEDILILELKIKEGMGPMKGTDKTFSFKKKKTADKSYKQVTIIHGDNESITVNVDFLG